jgi:hypothetical protein
MFIKLKNLFRKRKKKHDRMTPEGLIYEDFIENGNAIVDVNLNDDDEMFSPYSKKKLLNPKILAYLDEITDAIPNNYPMIINFIVKKTSKIDREFVKLALRRYYWLSFKKKQKGLLKESIESIAMLVVGLTIVMWYSFNQDIQFFFLQEMVFLASWILTWEGIGHFLVGRKDKVKDRDDEEQLALAKVTFEEKTKIRKGKK